MSDPNPTDTSDAMSDPNSTDTPDAPQQSPRRVRRSGFAGRYTSTIILGVVFLLLIGAVFLLTNNPNVGVLNVTPTPTPLPSVWDLSAGTAQAVRVDSITGTVAVQVVAGQWQLIAPTNEPASQTQVDSVVSSLKKLDAQQLITNTADLSAFGLATPALTVTLIMSGVTPVENRLLVGDATVDGGQYYVKMPDKPQVYTIFNTAIEPIKAWFTTPPKAEPTPTPLIIATTAPTATSTVTGTVGLAPTVPAASSPPVGTPTTVINAVTATPAAAAPATTASPLVNIGPATGEATATPGTSGAPATPGSTAPPAGATATP